MVCLRSGRYSRKVGFAEMSSTMRVAASSMKFGTSTTLMSWLWKTYRISSSRPTFLLPLITPLRKSMVQSLKGGRYICPSIARMR